MALSLIDLTHAKTKLLIALLILLFINLAFEKGFKFIYSYNHSFIIPHKMLA